MEKNEYISGNEFNKELYERYVIVMDVGGEHTHLAVMGIKDKKNYDIIFKITKATSEIKDISDLLNEGLKGAHNDYGIEINRAVIAGAGPVSRKRSYINLTNLDISIDTREILKKTMLRKVILVNDFEAIGYGMDLLDLEKDVVLLPHVGEDMTNTNILSNTFAIIGAGRGLGVSIAYYDLVKHMHVPLPSEGGHTLFSPSSELEYDLMVYLKQNIMSHKEAHPEFERVVSGAGIINIYTFLRSRNEFSETEATKKIDGLQGIEKLRAIDENLDDPTINETINLFIKFYARAAKNLAVMSECYSGLFIAGGIVLRYLEKFKEGKFMKEFELHDVRGDLLRKVPVYIIKNKDIGLIGCCNVAVNFYNIM